MKTKTPAQKFLFRIASEAKRDAKAKAPYITRNLRHDIQVFDDNIEQNEVAIGNTLLAPYALYVHQGTGLYARERGKTSGRIKKGGIKPNPYLENAVSEVLEPTSLNALADSLADDVGEDVVKGLKGEFKIV